MYRERDYRAQRGIELIDKAGNVFLLSGSVKAREALVVTMAEATMPLNNDGDEVVLLDTEGVGRSRVSYSETQVRAGVAVRFSR